MELWRLYREAHGPGLDGTGGLYTAGRWHLRGSRVVYFGASASTVTLERLAHVGTASLPDDLLLSKYAGELSVEDVASHDVHDTRDFGETHACGEAFLKRRTACVLRVPSVIIPEEYNFVFNPLHGDATKIELVSTRKFAFDSRLVRGLGDQGPLSNSRRYS